MRSRVLYFPYIRIPESRWLTQMLLYWDQVASIVPYQFVHEPESLGPYMLSLVREGLVFQVIPGAYISEIPRFGDDFLAYVESLGPERDRRRKQFADGKLFRVHIEKMGDIARILVRLRLARQQQYPWYAVEEDTADDFMSYLAAVLGQLESIDSYPVTDNIDYLERLVRAGVQRDHMARQLDSLRLQVLDRILPTPSSPLQPSAIRAFKERRGVELGDFRRRVERELVAAANIPDPMLRQRHLEIFFDEADARIEEIQSSMRHAGWETVRAGLSVIAALPGVSPLLGLAGAVWNAVTGEGRRGFSSDFAYAAHTRTRCRSPVAADRADESHETRDRSREDKFTEPLSGQNH